MSTRTPSDDRWESRVDRQIREAQERGDFDDLPGAGRPLADLDRPRDPDWWIRRKLREERFSHLPETLQVRRDLERAREEIDRAGAETDVRRIVTAINDRIRHVNRTAVDGPPSTVMPLDVEQTVARWRARRAGGR